MNTASAPSRDAASGDIAVVGGQVVTGSSVRTLDIVVSGGEIARMGPDLELAPGTRTIDARDKLVLPGIIDAHNHPYYEDDVEAFSLSALHGGVTTLVPFAGPPLPGRPLVEVVDRFIEGAASSYLDFGVHAIVGESDPPAEIVPALAERGVRSLKAFLAFPGVRMVSDGYLLDLMHELAAVDGLCMVHCENGAAISVLERRLEAEGHTDATAYEPSRPGALEAESAFRAATLARIAGCDLYIVHVSSAETLAVLADARQRTSARIHVETCPHYLLLTGAEQAELGALAKISPPMRRAEDIEVLWRWLANGSLDVVGSDASGQSRAGKTCECATFFDEPFGIPGVEHLLPLVLSEALARGISPMTVVEVLSERPAEIFGLDGKGRLRVGADADLVIVDPAASHTVRGDTQHGASDYSIYDGWEVTCEVVTTMQRGRILLHDGELLAQPGQGRYLPAATKGALR